MERRYRVIDTDCEPDVWYDSEADKILYHSDIEEIINKKDEDKKKIILKVFNYIKEKSFHTFNAELQDEEYHMSGFDLDKIEKEILSNESN